MLDDLNDDMDNTQSKLSKVMQKVDRVLEISKDKKSSCCMILLLLALIILIIVYFST
jgi:t-SNARE complex subunit (syntaxin)